MSGEATAEATVEPETRWHRIDEADLPGEGRVRSVVVYGGPVAVGTCAGPFGALESRRFRRHVVFDARLRPAARRSGRRARVTASPDHR